ncbi:DUF3667 domain-containing protein [Longibacter sp.]|jgi:hypothetical protein|uniref:DUF3667 domain-containing protein n=1 Tax=Longibacter sp. TaxID=2045415 RepID=UPI003EB92C0F
MSSPPTSPTDPPDASTADGSDRSERAEDAASRNPTVRDGAKQPASERPTPDKAASETPAIDDRPDASPQEEPGPGESSPDEPPDGSASDRPASDASDIAPSAGVSDPTDQGTTGPTTADDLRAMGDAPPRSACANCGAPLVGPYCSQCGQRAAERIVPLHEMTQEWVEDLFEFDLRIFRTLPTFFFKPGRLTKEYVRGRRVRYVRPLRLYLVASFILFTLLAFSDLATVDTIDTTADVPAVPDTAAATANLSPATLDSLARAALERQSADPSAPAPNTDGNTPESPQGLDTTAVLQSLQSLEGLGSLDRLENLGQGNPLSATDRAAIDSLTQVALARATQTARSSTGDAARAPDQGRTMMAQKVAENIDVNIFEDPQQNAEAQTFLRERIARTIEDPNSFVRGMIDRAPFVMFLLLPIFALLLKLLYARRAKLYVQHLIFALHFHALAFLVFALATGLLITDSNTLHAVGAWTTLFPFIYLYIAMHHVYEQGWGKTFVKVMILLGIYNTVIAIALVLLAIANFLLL